MKEDLTYIDLFAGCGGLSYGLFKAGWKGIFAIEKDKYAFETLKYNLIENLNHFKWPNWLTQEKHDITEILKEHKKELEALRGSVTMVAGGPPCQGFSLAGDRDENDARNSLVDSYINFISIVEPKVIFFENVKGFTINFKKKGASKGKNYSEYVIKKLGKDYYTDYALLDFSEFGIPQRRSRFILVGLRKKIFKEERVKEFFKNLKENKKKFLKSLDLNESITLEEAISDLLQSNGTLPSPDTRSFNAGVYANSEILSNYQKALRANIEIKEQPVDSHRFAKHTEEIVDRFKFAINNKLTSGKYKKHFGLNKTTTKLLIAGEPAPTLTTLPDDCIHYCEPRILTVREYARIQSFPDTYEIKGKYTTGNDGRKNEVPRYSQIGNAIPPLFAEQSGIVLKDLICNG